jgi:hypothetical protein
MYVVIRERSCRTVPSGYGRRVVECGELLYLEVYDTEWNSIVRSAYTLGFEDKKCHIRQEYVVIKGVKRLLCSAVETIS